MKYKKGDIVYTIRNNKVVSGVVQKDFEEPPVGERIFKDKEDAKAFLKLMNKVKKDLKFNKK